MGASHAVISLGDLSHSSFDDEYFRSAGITWPEGLRGARNPTPRELSRVLRGLGAYHIEYDATGHWLDVTISNSMDAQDWAVIWVENYAGLASEDKPLPLSFHRGNEPLVLRIMSEIAKVCGPFLGRLQFRRPILVSKPLKCGRVDRASKSAAKPLDRQSSRILSLAYTAQCACQCRRSVPMPVSES
jgi:hypothetical protein